METSTEPHASTAHAQGALAHVLPARALLAVFGALLVLTVVTVRAADYDLGSWGPLTAIAIATVKAALVALYFMHLRYDHPFNALVFVVGLAFLGLFLAITLLDTLQYQPNIQTFSETLP